MTTEQQTAVYEMWQAIADNSKYMTPKEHAKVVQEALEIEDRMRKPAIPSPLPVADNQQWLTDFLSKCESIESCQNDIEARLDALEAKVKAAIAAKAERQSRFAPLFEGLSDEPILVDHWQPDPQPEAEWDQDSDEYLIYQYL